MWVEQITAGFFITNAYVVGDPETKQGIVIDVPPESYDRLLAYIQKKSLKIIGIFLTHSHFDHFADAKKLQDVLKCPIYAHREELENLETPGSDGIPFGIGLDPVKVDHFLEDQQTYSVGNLSFEVIETPGHTPGGVCFYFEKEKALFTGDTLFKGTHGRTDFPRCDMELLYDSLKKLAHLSGDIVVYPGHNPETTTIGAEKKWINTL